MTDQEHTLRLIQEIRENAVRQQQLIDELIERTRPAYDENTPGDVGYAERERLRIFPRPKRIPSSTPIYRRELLKRLPAGYRIPCKGIVPTDLELAQAVQDYEQFKQPRRQR